MRLRTPQQFMETKSFKLFITDGTNESGGENVIGDIDVEGRIEGCNSIIFTKDGGKLTVTKKAFIFKTKCFDKYGDVVTGYCMIDKERYECPRIFIRRNPDGSINHVMIEML